MSYQIKQKRVGPPNPTAGTYTISIPTDARILRARIRQQTDRMVVWYLTDTDVTEVKDRTIIAIENNTDITEDVAAMRAIGYGQSAGALLHIFELYFDGQGGILE